MASDLVALYVDAHDPARAAGFWATVLDGGTTQEGGAVTVRSGDDPGFAIRFVETTERRTHRNWTHFDLTSATPEEQQETVDRALAAGGSHLDVGQRPEEGHVVLADPEGNELCVVEAGNSFLAGCPRIGALSSDGSPEVGRFWSAALGWPLVWDQDEETAIQSPTGGSKISWGGPPYNEKPARNRLRLALAPAAGTDRDAEVDRLVALGATRLDGDGDAGGVRLADPDGNEFSLA